ncbi:MAG: hypothetical protein P1P88_23455 [Bacteroidales bacterium]|nr:hypothetical protein [Bacteroidales bacterium]
MKKLSLIIILVFACNFLFSQTKSQRKYAVKSGHVEYELSGNTTGTKSFWWDNYGQKSRTEIKSTTTTKVFGMTSTDEVHNITVINGTDIYTWDLIKKTGQKSINDENIQMGNDIAKDMTEAEQKKLADDILNSLGGERLGTESFMGRTCEIIEVLGCKSWIYKGLSLKSEAKVLMIKSFENATKIEENINLPASTFEPDKSIEYQDINELQNQAYANVGMDDVGVDNDENEEKNVQVKYPFGSFERVINNFKYKNYRKTMLTSQDGQHQAMFNKLINSISIVAASVQNDDAEMAGETFAEFKHQGKTCRYGTVEGGIGSALIVDYPSYDMHIAIVAMPRISKEELLKISDMLNF